jgi:E3 ubiquitin-protein ligase SIAH1
MQSEASDIGKSVLIELQCPACKQYMVPPITFCLGGHNICSNCRPIASSCPTCKQWFLKTRNVSLENLSLQMKFPCRYSKYGCKETFPYNAFREHEAICDYSPQTCPVDYMRLKMICTWTGISKDLKEHLSSVHEDLCEDYNAQHLLLLPNSHASYSYKFLFAYNEIFCYRLLFQRGIMYVVLHYIGPAENDLKYQYKVIVMNNEDTEGVVVTHLARSFTEIEDNEFFPKNCLKLHHDLTERFRNEKGELPVLLKILRFDD